MPNDINSFVYKTPFSILCFKSIIFSSIILAVKTKASSSLPEGSSKPQSSKYFQGKLGQLTLHPIVMTISTSGISLNNLLF